MTEVITLHNKPTAAKSGYCQTPTGRAVTNVLSTCQSFSLMGVVVGEPGTGKTTAIGEFAQGNDKAALCRMTKAAAKLQPGLVRMAGVIGAYVTPNMGSADLYDEIARRLSRSHNMLLVIDEAQHMEDELLETVRDLYDECHVGVVLVGNYDLKARYTDQTNKRRYSNFKQLRGRIRSELILDKPLSEDIDALCVHHGIEGGKARALIAKAANMPGGLHNVAGLLTVAAKLAENGEITYTILSQAAEITGAR